MTVTGGSSCESKSYQILDCKRFFCGIVFRNVTATSGRTEVQMSVSDPAQAALAEATSTIDRDARLSPGMAIIAVVALSVMAWAIVVLVAMGLRAAFS
jgi:hypothetical protein